MDFKRRQQHPVATVTPSGVVEINDLTFPHTQKQYLQKRKICDSKTKKCTIKF